MPRRGDAPRPVSACARPGSRYKFTRTASRGEKGKGTSRGVLRPFGFYIPKNYVVSPTGHCERRYETRAPTADALFIFARALCIHLRHAECRMTCGYIRRAGGLARAEAPRDNFISRETADTPYIIKHEKNARVRRRAALVYF